jgi:UDP-N-acetylglucosamine/UDP-N-acetylgalactosamine diphosphorylase
MQVDTLKKIQQYNQAHLLKFRDSLDLAGQEQLDAQLETIDWDTLDTLIKEYVLQKPQVKIPENLEPAPYYPIKPENEQQQALYAKAEALGRDLLRNGKVATLTVAGGQGTRLGFDGPKGTFPISPVKSKSLFQYFAETLIRIRQKYGKPMKWYIMTSEMNNEATVQHFTDNNFFGLDHEQVMFFTQGTMPAIGTDGKLLLGAKDSLALAPDGHGGTLLALKRSGALEEMNKNGVEYISYFQVDNPLITIANPLFLGLHALDESEMSAIMLAKTGPFEKLGNFCKSGNALEIIEYSDMPEELARQTDADGKLRFIAGSPAIHVISRSFIERLTSGGRLNLPWHRADKKVPYIDDAGNEITPENTNAVKLESFIFDALPLASKTMVLEAAREDEFAPTKNRTGVDSVDSCREMMIDRDCRRLEAAGVAVPRNADGVPVLKVEISPLAVIDQEDAVAYVQNKHVNIPAEAGELYLD